MNIIMNSTNKTYDIRHSASALPPRKGTGAGLTACLLRQGLIGTGFLLALLLTSCSDDLFTGTAADEAAGRINLSGEIDQLAVTRVNDNGFCDGDVMGVYIVDYDGNTPGTLQVSGNRGDNVRHTFDEAAYKWSSAYDLYWKDKHTHIDVYGYYPFGSPESIDAYPFNV